MALLARILVDRKSKARICPVCQRDRKLAIQEQLEYGTGCGNAACKFKDEISTVLQIAGSDSVTNEIEKQNIGGFQRALEIINNIEEKIKNSLKNTKRAQYENPENNRKQQNVNSWAWIGVTFLLLFYGTPVIYGAYRYLFYNNKSAQYSLYDQKPGQYASKSAYLTSIYHRIAKGSATNTKKKTTNKIKPDCGNGSLYELNPAYLINHIWRGTIGNDSLTIVFESYKEGVLKGYSLYRYKYRPFEGGIRYHQKGGGSIQMLEPGDKVQDGGFELSFNSRSGKMNGNWLDYYNQHIEQVIIWPDIKD